MYIYYFFIYHTKHTVIVYRVMIYLHNACARVCVRVCVCVCVCVGVCVVDPISSDIVALTSIYFAMYKAAVHTPQLLS